MDDTDYEGYYTHLALHKIYTNKLKEKVVFTKEQLEKNKFYIGSNSIFKREGGNGWGHPTVEEAVTHAQSMLSKDESTDAVFIVQIVKVVKRKPIDVIIEDV